MLRWGSDWRQAPGEPATQTETDPGQHGSALDFWMRQGLVVPACVVIPAVGESRFGRRDFFGELLKHGLKFVDCPVFLGNSQPEERLVRFQEPRDDSPLDIPRVQYWFDWRCDRSDSHT